MATALAVSPRPQLAPALPANIVPTGVSSEMASAIMRGADRAIRFGHSVVAMLPAGQRAGAPVVAWVVSSASRPGAGWLVWVEAGRLLCGCEQRQFGGLTCSHAQAVRLCLLGWSAPVPPVPPSPSSPTDIPLTLSAPGAICLSCEREAEASEVEQLGECLRCCLARAGVSTPARCVRAVGSGVCGALAVGETTDGALCQAHLDEWGQRQAWAEERAFDALQAQADRADAAEAALAKIARDAEAESASRRQWLATKMAERAGLAPAVETRPTPRRRPSARPRTAARVRLAATI